MKIRDLRNMAIIGPGLLGGSIGLGLKAAGVGGRIIGIGHRRTSVTKALRIGAIDDGTLDLAAAEPAQLVVLATPIGLFEQTLSRLGDILRPGTVITDVGSTKRHVCGLAQRMLPKHLRFVGSHPMAGSEKRGVDFARSDLCQNATCIVTPTAATARSALTLVRDLWATLGMRLVSMSPAEHDRVLAKVSHLPHVVAAALVNLCSKDEMKITGPGFLDTTRIASGDVQLWHDIIVSNPQALLAATQTVRKQLDELDRAAQTGDSQRIRSFLASAKKKRDWLINFQIKTNRLER